MDASNAGLTIAEIKRAVAEAVAEQIAAREAARDVFDTDGAASYLGVSRQLLELMRVNGGGPRYVKLGRLVRYRRATLDEWLIERERAHTSERAL
jgi:excisionase family DNA binding protein